MKRTRTRRPLAETNVVTKRGTGADVNVSSVWLGQKVRVDLIDEKGSVVREVKRVRQKGSAHVWVPKDWLGYRVKVTPIEE